MKIEVGTLQDIGAQVGDVVEWCGHGHPRQWTISLIRGGNYYEGDDHEAPLSDEPYWRIISSANQGPVREVTRKEIVPGVYGRISVHKNTWEDEKVLLRFADSAGEVDLDADGHYMSRDELTAAINTLTQIRDAMEEMK